jgi:isopentenyl diphosphate isomerase/L-lactate dehydrogenase-like FMN-dependent dehydrogenase
MTAIYSVGEARRRARRALPRIVFDYVEGGADDERTLAANERSFAAILFRPRMGVHVPDPELRTSVLGRELALPVLLAPCGGLSMIHPAGQQAAARAAANARTITVVSTLCGALLEDAIPRGGGGECWFQLYKLGGRAGAEVLVERAHAAGYGALVVAVDTPVVGNKERDVRNGGVRPGGTPAATDDLRSMLRFAPRVVTRPRWTYRFARAGFPLGQPNLARLAADGRPIELEQAMAAWRAEPATWEDFSWIRERWPGTLVAKGILSADDARRAVDAGANAVVISNHGGRQLDGTPATIDVLPGVVSAVGDQVGVLLDGGVRRGADVVRALALGAQAVLIGRPYLYGLATGGEAGVQRVLEIFREELVRTLQLLGCPSIQMLNRSWLWPAGTTER